ncbi:MAG: 50S ribosomal protein L35 [candidate division WOR-3 bacterium]|nr:50S ribosomal protein L35 [candidate division WOR-3 bacterium]
MPKLKNKGAIKKRLKKTKKGKIKFRRANSNHLQSKHSNKNRRRCSGEKEVSSGDRKRIKRLMH